MSHHDPAIGAATPAHHEGRHAIDLTGYRSHILLMEPGVGSLRIGPAALGQKADLHVEPHERLAWNVFDPFATQAGSPWPRFLSYTGSDTGFVNWASQRSIEEMVWTPVLAEDTRVDASQAALHRLAIHLEPAASRLHMILPSHSTWAYRHLSLNGELSRFVAEGELPWSLALAPRTSPRRHAPPFELPDLGILHQVEHLALQNGPMAQPVSLKCLRRFTQLRSLDLWGHFCDLHELARHPRLEALELRFMPDLQGLPALDSWPALERFIAFNVEEATGKRLRQQVKARGRVRGWNGHASVSQLRKPLWWEAEYGRPFSTWPKRLAKIANGAYDQALASLALATDEAQAEAALSAFARHFNSLKGIESSERDDLGEAIWQLSQSEHAVRLGVSAEQAQAWFDQVRDY